MTKKGEDWRPDFEQALGDTFGELVCPPVPFEDASPGACCEVVWKVVGRDVTPKLLDAVGEDALLALARRFGEDFDCEAPSLGQIREAIDETLARWPVGSLGDDESSGEGSREEK